MSKSIFILIFTALFISSFVTAQEKADTTTRVKVVSYIDLVQDLEDSKANNKANQNLINERLKSIPTENISKELLEKLKKVPVDKLIRITKEQLETIPLIDGKRTISYSNLKKLEKNNPQSPDLPEHCIGTVVCSCQCYGYTLWVIYIPNSVCICNCIPGVGIMIICEDPCETVWADCAF